jgi:hypothetical protein
MSPADANRLRALESAPLNSWIALSDDESRIVAVGRTLEELSARLDEIDEPVVISKTPPVWGPMVL